jgi:hypothetical protein
MPIDKAVAITSPTSQISLNSLNCVRQPQVADTSMSSELILCTSACKQFALFDRIAFQIPRT